MISKKSKLRRIVISRLTVFCKLAIFYPVIGFSEKFTVKDLKCDYDAKHQKNKVKTKIQRGVKILCKLRIF